MISEKPMGPDERIVRYAEFAAKYDVHEALDMKGRHLSFFEFYNLDVLLTMLGGLLLILFLVLKMVVVVFRCIRIKLFGQKTKRE